MVVKMKQTAKATEVVRMAEVEVHHLSYDKNEKLILDETKTLDIDITKLIALLKKNASKNSDYISVNDINSSEKSFKYTRMYLGKIIKRIYRLYDYDKTLLQSVKILQDDFYLDYKVTFNFGNYGNYELYVGKDNVGDLFTAFHGFSCIWNRNE